MALSQLSQCDYPASQDGHSMPLLYYADQSCPSDTGLVDDAAVFQAKWSWILAGNSSDGTSYYSSKTVGRLLRPSGIVITSDEMYWTEQDAGT
eukprot:6484444-Prymnesium_polylepis.1